MLTKLTYIHIKVVGKKGNTKLLKEDVVKIDKFIFLTDFIVLDLEEDKEVPIIVGRPFLATNWALIDVQKGELKLRVQDEEVKFNVFNTIKYLVESDSFFSVNVVEAIMSNHVGHIDPLKTILTHGVSSESDDEEIKVYLMWMDSFDPTKRKYFESLGASLSHPIPSIERPLILDEKPLTTHLIFAYLGVSSTLSVIISSSLSQFEKEKLLRVLCEH